MFYFSDNQGSLSTWQDASHLFPLEDEIPETTLIISQSWLEASDPQDPQEMTREKAASVAKPVTRQDDLSSTH